jgi:hypothetical protein
LPAFRGQIGIDSVTGQQVPINGGARLTGTIGRTELGIMEVDTRSSGPNPYTNYAVARLKESLWAGSYVGVMGIDKRSGNPVDSFNQTGGVDTRLVFFKDWFVDAHMAGTRSPGDPSGASDVGASLSYRSNWLDGIVERRKIGPNFNPEVGFIERTDSNETYGDLTFKVRPKIRGIRELQFEGFILHAPDTQGNVSTQEWQNTFRADFHNGAYTDDDIVDVFTQQITTPFHIYRNVFIPNGIYNFTRHQLTYGSGQERRFTYSFFERFGGYYSGTLNEFRVRANYRPTAKFSISASETWDRFRLPLPNGNFSVVLASLQGNYSFNRFLTFTSLIGCVQYGAAAKRVGSHGRDSCACAALASPTSHPSSLSQSALRRQASEVRAACSNSAQLASIPRPRIPAAAGILDATIREFLT